MTDNRFSRTVAMRRLAIVLAVLLGSGLAAAAQEPAYREDLRFVEALRARNDNDLALELLQKVAKGAPPELAKELSLEFAKTRLRLAGGEPDGGKRLALFKQARDDFQTFLTANPGHPRAVEANLEIARVLDLQGKTELSQALLQEDAKAKQAAALQARATLATANQRLEAALKELRTSQDKLPDPATITDLAQKKQAQDARARLDREITQTDLDRALNLYAQSQTYLGGVDDEGASRLIQQAVKALRPTADGAPANPVTWKARAWLGRCLYEIETADKARALFQDVLAANRTPVTDEGQRLARYFRLLVIQKSPSDADKKKGVPAILEDAARRWRQDYPKFLNTPEGRGITFLYAQVLLGQADNPKMSKPERDKRLQTARALLKEVESSENEFTDRARRLKITTIVKQGGFKVPLAKLSSFEDCYIRAQFEAHELNREAHEAKDPKEFDKKRKERLATIIAALERGLTLPDAKSPGNALERNNARAMLAYWCLNAGKYDDAIRVGEGFARDDPRSAQAASAAVYALQAHAQRVIDRWAAAGKRPAAFDDPAAGEERAALFRLAHYVEERWPREAPGDLARHQIALQLLRDENFPEAIKKLGTVSPAYASYPFVQWQLADAAFKAAKEGTEPIPGDRPGDYRKRAVQALERVPDSFLGADPATNHITVLGKVTLGNELYGYKRFQEMQDLATRLLARLDGLRFHAEADKDRALREQFHASLVNITLFASYGLADAAAGRGDHAEVVKLLDPLVDQLNKGEGAARDLLRKDTRLATATLALALKSNIQLGKIDRTEAVLASLDQVTAEGAADAGTTHILKLLAALIRQQVEEVRKTRDKQALDKAVAGYSALLSKRVKKEKKLTPEFIRVLADCYASMGQHDKAAAELEKVPDPKGKPGSAEEKAYRGVQLRLARELRLSGTPDNLKKAAKLLEKAIGTAAAPGWGRKDLFAQKEHGLLLEAQGKYREAFAVWSPLSKNLARLAGRDADMKEHFLECYYHMVFSFYKDGQAKASKSDREKATKTAALEIARLEKGWEEFGGGASKKRFEELLAQERGLKEEYLAARKKLR
jgi:hypothetical protein